MKRSFKNMILGVCTSLMILGVCTSLMILGAVQPETRVLADSGNQTEDQTEDDYFLNIGSVSKIYTTTAVMQLVSEDKVDLDAPVTDYIPEFVMADERYKDITVRMLMDHTSGLMGSVYGHCFSFEAIGSEYHDSFLSILSKERLKADPGAYNCYCNDGFTLLEMIVERVSGMSFTDYLKKNIAEPLGAKNTGSGWSLQDHYQIPVRLNSSVTLNREVPQLVGAGGLGSTAEDLSVFGTAFFDGNDVLLPQELKDMMAADSAAFDSAEHFGLGWDDVCMADYENAGVKVVKKGGATFSQYAALAVAPEEEISVAVLCSGGNGDVPDKLSQELLDIALEEKGIHVTHENPVPETVDSVPDDYLKYAGIYNNANLMLEVSFPDQRYMLLRSVNSENDFSAQFMYTTEDSFAAVSGEIESGNAILDRTEKPFYFKEIGGEVYVCQNGAAMYQKSAENPVSDEVQAAWAARDGVTYLIYDGSFSDENYANNLKSVTLAVNDEVRGYVNGSMMIDASHAENRVHIPGSASRDISDITITEEDGKEILSMDAMNIKYVSETDVPDFGEETEVKLETGKASWFRINGAVDVTLDLEIPENAAVYVYDRFGNVMYSSFMTEYGTGVPLPNYGMIVFIGETGSSVKIARR